MPRVLPGGRGASTVGFSCRCRPSWRGRPQSGQGQPERQKPVVKHRREVLAWLGAAHAARAYAAEVGPAQKSFDERYEHSWAGEPTRSRCMVAVAQRYARLAVAVVVAR